MYTKQDNPKLYNSWRGMRYRCLNSNATDYQWYGGKGITTYEGWARFKDFAIWAFENGYKEGLSIERIDSNGNYKPSNCTWISKVANTVDGNSHRYRAIYEECYHHWYATRCTGMELSKIADKSFSVTCGWIRGWKANNMQMVDAGSVTAARKT